MAHPVIWPDKFFFYPLGNTTAACFTSGLPPEQSADILLLGCGDARNVLYTVYADLGAPSRSLDFTCCDVEPAVLARNVLLYTLIADLPPDDVDGHISKIWNFYYHFFIDENTLDMLLGQCQRLIDLSADVVAWNSSKYGTFLKFCTAHTLSALRRHWALYVETKKLSKAEKDSLLGKFRKRDLPNDRKKAVSYTSIRSAGPLWTKLKDIGARQFEHYWETGVTFDDAKQVAAANLINPSFAYSSMGLGFELHYASDPLLSFHLARALAPIKGSNSNEFATISSLVKSAMVEFKTWCQSFSKRLKAQPAALVIRFFSGDALAFCRALHFCAVNKAVDTGVYVMPWSSTLIKLDGGDYIHGATHRAPLGFNVIDTSNLVDHLGLLNVLILCKSLMQRTPSSILHTNTLYLPSGGEDTGREGFLELLCSDISILSMILDIIPVSYASNFTSHSSTHEKVKSQFHEQVSWRICSLAGSANVQLQEHRLTFDEKKLASYFYHVYTKMFHDENVGAMFQSIPLLGSLNRFTLVHYTRFSFAYLLRIVKDRVHLDWDTFINNLHDLICNDRGLLTGSNNVQDMFCAFYLLDVYSFSPYVAGFNDSLAKKGFLKGWKDVPAVVCITFQVPRDRFKCLKDANVQKVGSLIFICALMGNPSHNYFQHYQSFFGRAKAEYDLDPAREPVVTFDEDPSGFHGSSPAVFTFYIPTWLLGVDRSIQVTVSVRSNPFTSTKFMPILGPYLTLFSADIADRTHVHITRERPGNVGELQKLRYISSSRAVSNDPPLSDAIKVGLDSDGKGVSILTGRANIVDAKGKAALSNKASVEICQISSQAVRVSIGNYHQVIPYPLPVDSTNSKTRIARKSSYVEVDVKVARPGQILGMSLNPFPLVTSEGKVSLWNIHYIDLERLPALDLSSSKKLDFVTLHVVMAFSDRERRLCKAEDTGGRAPADVMTRVKQSIHALFASAHGLRGKRFRVLGLSDPDNGGTYTLIFINDARLDLASHAIVLDAAVLPLTEKLVESLSKAIWRVNNAGIMQIKTDPDEVKAWKHLLPAFAERCRKWKHTPNCEYLSKGVPVSEEMEQSPLCSCGKGKDLGAYAQNKEWKPFMPHCTRMAISPLFAVPFSDTIDESMLDSTIASKASSACAKCGSPGKPKLLLCSACKNASYCSVECQKADWKLHKTLCKKS